MILQDNNNVCPSTSLFYIIYNKFVACIHECNYMSTARIPDDMERDLRSLKIRLELNHGKAAPSIQDLVSVALKRLLRDLNSEDSQEVEQELLQHRQQMLEKMGRPNPDS